MKDIKLYITVTALRDMWREITAFHDEETSWGNYGVILENGKAPVDVYICGVLRPSPGDIVRNYATTTLGGPDQAEKVTWLEKNFNLMKKRGEVPSNMHFCYLYKGHSHHGLSFKNYSGQDVASIYDIIQNIKLEVAIGPLGLYSGFTHNHSTLPGTLDIGESGQIRFYVLTQDMVKSGKRQPDLIDTKNIIVIPDNKAPKLPPLPWHILNSARFEEEYKFLEKYCQKVSISLRVSPRTGWYKLIFRIQKPNWKNDVLIETDYDFPKAYPIFRVGPERKSMRITSSIWTRNDPLVKGLYSLEKEGKL